MTKNVKKKMHFTLQVMIHLTVQSRGALKYALSGLYECAQEGACEFALKGALEVALKLHLWSVALVDPMIIAEMCTTLFYLIVELMLHYKTHLMLDLMLDSNGRLTVLYENN